MGSSLPPPPSTPMRPPVVPIAGEAKFELTTADGESLAALGRLPSHAARAVVLCHPHPLYGGTMHNAVIVAMTKQLRERAGDDVATVRFNFRGVEGSSGTFTNGPGEKLDVLAAIDGVLNELPNARVSVVGYSFGAWVGLRAAWEHPEVERAALVAPAVRLFDFEESSECRRPLPAELVVGDRDGFVDVIEARKLARFLGARMHVIDGADHFFVGYRRKVADTLLAFVAPELME